jgi:hypothetical protein
VGWVLRCAAFATAATLACLHCSLRASVVALQARLALLIEEASGGVSQRQTLVRQAARGWKPFLKLHWDWQEEREEGGALALALPARESQLERNISLADAAADT